MTRKRHVTRYLANNCRWAFKKKKGIGTTERIKANFLKVERLDTDWVVRRKEWSDYKESEWHSCGLNRRDTWLVPGVEWICCCVTGGGSHLHLGLSDHKCYTLRTWDQVLVAEPAMTPAVSCLYENHISLNHEQINRNQQELPSGALPPFFLNHTSPWSSGVVLGRTWKL